MHFPFQYHFIMTH